MISSSGRRCAPEPAQFFGPFPPLPARGRGRNTSTEQAQSHFRGNPGLAHGIHALPQPPESNARWGRRRAGMLLLFPDGTCLPLMEGWRNPKLSWGKGPGSPQGVRTPRRLSQVSTVTAGCFATPGLSFSVFCKASEPVGLGPELSNPLGSGPWSCPAHPDCHPPGALTARRDAKPTSLRGKALRTVAILPSLPWPHPLRPT